MLICHCHAVSERRIRKTVRSGCTSLRAIARRCGAGSGCGGCRPALAQILDEELRVAEAREDVVAGAGDLADAILVP